MCTNFDEIIELEIDKDLVETLEDIVGPLGWTVEELFQAVFEVSTEYFADPRNEEKVAELVAQWRSEGLLSSEEE